MEDHTRKKIEAIVHGRFGTHLGLVMESCKFGECTVRLPYCETVSNNVHRIHGGAISGLIDTAATAAAWADDSLDENARGTTMSLTVNFLAAGRESDLLAHARSSRRGGSVIYLHVDVQDASGTAVAEGLVTYKLDRGRRRD